MTPNIYVRLFANSLGVHGPPEKTSYDQFKWDIHDTKHPNVTDLIFLK